MSLLPPQPLFPRELSCFPLGTVFAYKTYGNFTELSYFTALNSISGQAFYNVTCNRIVISEGITSFGSSSLHFTRAQIVDLPSTMTAVPNYTQGSAVWIFRAANPPTINAYSDLGRSSIIYVPADSVSAYKTASGWTGYANQIQAISE